MPLHPQAVAFLNEYHGLNPVSRDTIPLAVTRQQLLGTTDIPPSCPTPAKMEDRTLRGRSGDVRLRIHTPERAIRRLRLLSRRRLGLRQHRHAR